MANDYSSKRMNIVRKSIATFVALMLVLGMLFSSGYIAEKFHHDCAGEDCPICQTIAQCETFLNRITTGIIFFVVSVLAVITAVSSAMLMERPVVEDTLVRCKVRLNN